MVGVEVVCDCGEGETDGNRSEDVTGVVSTAGRDDVKASCVEINSCELEDTAEREDGKVDKREEVLGESKRVCDTKDSSTLAADKEEEVRVVLTS